MHRFDVAILNLTSDITNYDTYNFPNSPFCFSDESGCIEGCFPNLVDLEFPRADAVNFSISSSVDNDYGWRAKNVSVVSGDSQFGGLNNSFGSDGMGLNVGTGHFTLQNGCLTVVAGGDGVCCLAVINGPFDKWGDSGYWPITTSTMAIPQIRMADTRFSKDIHALKNINEAGLIFGPNSAAYVQQLENCNPRLSQLQEELQSAQKQVILGVSGDQGHSSLGNGDLAFDMGYARWLDEHHRLTYGLRSAVNDHAGDTELRLLIDGIVRVAVQRTNLWP